MIFTTPIQIRDAAKNLEVKAILPTTLDSAQIAKLGPQVNQLAVISSNVYQADFLTKVKQVVESIVSPHTEDGVSRGFNRATARTALKDSLKKLGYQPPSGQAGRIVDLSSDQRLNLIIDTLTSMARGFGQWKTGMGQQLIQTRPASELYRAEDRIEPRPWEEIWPEAAAAIDPDAFDVYQSTGEMIARKDSPIWMQISDFGNPFPPFKWNSGMWTKDVKRADAMALGLDVDGVEPLDADFVGKFQMDVKDLGDQVLQQIISALPPGFKVEGGLLKAA